MTSSCEEHLDLRHSQSPRRRNSTRITGPVPAISPTRHTSPCPWPIDAAMLGEDVLDVSRVPGDVPGPHAKAAVGIGGLDPQIKEAALRLILLGVLSFDFQNQVA